jgi:hypothetical protein
MGVRVTGVTDDLDGIVEAAVYGNVPTELVDRIVDLVAAEVRRLHEQRDAAESFYAIRRTDGEPMDGENLTWMTVLNPDDWEFAVECVEDFTADDEPLEFEIVRMTSESVAKRSFPERRVVLGADQ